MSDDLLYDFLPILVHIIEFIGVFVVAVGAFRAFIEYLKVFSKGIDPVHVRYNLGTAMVTGLEFKMAAEIIRTVIVRTWQEIFLLGAIIVLREILFYFINKDIKEHKKQSGEIEDKPNKKITGIKIERN